MMNKRPSRAMTPEASTLLDQRLAQLREMVINVALSERATEEKKLSEITASDISTALIKLNIASEDLARRELRGVRLRRFFIIYFALFSATVAAFSVVYALREIQPVDKWPAVLAATASFFGMAVAIRALLASRYARRYSAALSDAVSNASTASDLLRLWTRLEHAMRSRVREEGGEPDDLPLGSVMQRYAELVNLPADEFMELRRILQARNEIAHNRAPDISNLGEVISLARKHLRLAQGGH